MPRYLIVMIPLVLSAILGGCREDFTFRSSSGELRFSRDTVYLDTVFNGISTATYNLKVFNTSGDDIRIPEVYLENGENSAFRLNVNGQAGKYFSDVEIPARDSIFIFIEATLSLTDPNPGGYLLTDAINFGESTSVQQVQLVTLVRDAVFLYPDRISGIPETIPIGTDETGTEIRISGFELEDDQLTFTKDKPYVIYGYAAVPSGKTLLIEAGTRVHFHEASGLLVQQGGRLVISGDESTDPALLENEVIFEGDRLEPRFSNVPGQWGTLWIAPGSTGNSIKHLTVKNAIVGLLVEGDPSPDPVKLQLENSRFLNSSNINILARNTSITAVNTITGNAGQVSTYLTEGGDYRFTHTTIANYWNSGFRSYPSLVIDNFRVNTDNTTQAFPLSRAEFTNCIITGNSEVEYLLYQDPNAVFNVSFAYCLLQFETTDAELLSDPLYDFDDTALYTSIIRNGNPGFKDAVSENFMLTADSEAIDAGDPALLNEFPTDINGIVRDAQPDNGAHEFTGN